ERWMGCCSSSAEPTIQDSGERLITHCPFAARTLYCYRCATHMTVGGDHDLRAANVHAKGWLGGYIRAAIRGGTRRPGEVLSAGRLLVQRSRGPEPLLPPLALPGHGRAHAHPRGELQGPALARADQPMDRAAGEQDPDPGGLLATTLTESVSRDGRSKG